MAHTLDQIVREYMIEKGDQTEHSYPRLLQLAIHGLRELNLDVSGAPKMVSLPIKDNLTVDLPSDYINYVRIGVCNSQGVIESLGRNDALCLPRSTDDCGNPRIDVRETERTTSFNNIDSGFLGSNTFNEGVTNNFRNSEFIGRLFGRGGGENSFGSYRIDTERNTIQFDSRVTGNIVLEYISDVNKANGTCTVHPFVVETLKCYVAWADIRRKKNQAGQAEYARRDYYNEMRNTQLRFSSINIAEAYQAFRTGTKLSPKL